MTRTTTALITAGPRTIGPWGDRAWRIALTIQLVEGGSAAYFLSTPTNEPIQQVSPAEVVIEAPHDECTLSSLIMTLAAQLGTEHAQALLEESHNLTMENDIRHIAPYWDLSDELQRQLAQELAEIIRIGVVVLDSTSLVNPILISKLRDHGFDVDLYSLDSQFEKNAQQQV